MRCRKAKFSVKYLAHPQTGCTHFAEIPFVLGKGWIRSRMQKKLRSESSARVTRRNSAIKAQKPGFRAKSLAVKVASKMVPKFKGFRLPRFQRSRLEVGDQVLGLLTCEPPLDSFSVVLNIYKYNIYINIYIYCFLPSFDLDLSICLPFFLSSLFCSLGLGPWPHPAAGSFPSHRWASTAPVMGDVLCMESHFSMACGWSFTRGCRVFTSSSHSESPKNSTSTNRQKKVQLKSCTSHQKSPSGISSSRDGQPISRHSDQNSPAARR